MASDPSTDSSQTCMSYCYKATLAILAFILIAFTVVCTGCLVLLGIAVSDCDLTCDEDADGAELLNEGYYDCDGDTSCGPFQPMFFFMLYLTLALYLIWAVALSICCWRRRQHTAATAAAADREAATVEAVKAETDLRHGSGHVDVLTAAQEDAVGVPMAVAVVSASCPDKA